MLAYRTLGVDSGRHPGYTERHQQYGRGEGGGGARGGGEGGGSTADVTRIYRTTSTIQICAVLSSVILLLLVLAVMKFTGHA